MVDSLGVHTFCTISKALGHTDDSLIRCFPFFQLIHLPYRRDS